VKEKPLIHEVALAWLVHLYTALGAYVGMLSLLAAWRGDVRTAFLWMLAATFIDATDGFLARAFKVRERIPHIDGRRLDDCVDYFTYVILPVAVLVFGGLLPPTPWLAALPLVASGLGFANEQAKTVDNYFLGFPSYWNVVAFYMWLFQTPQAFNGAVVVILSVLVLVPVRYIYPSRTRPLQSLTLALAVLWGLQCLAQLLWPERMPSWWWLGTAVFPLYYMLASIYLHFTEPAGEPGQAGEH
jgi:phosphatidylcholine synthase